MRETTINRSWLIKMVIFIVATGLFGLWGLYDALVAYPNRGEGAAEWAEMEYLDAAESYGVFLQASVDNPAEELARLRDERNRLERARQGSPEGSRQRDEADFEIRRLDWLSALSRIGALRPSRTTFEEPRERLAELRLEWQAKNPPKPLQAYDIPLQWVIFVVFCGVSVTLMALVGLVSRKKFRYDPETMTLELADGRKITPDDIREVDKRKWDKFYVFLQMKEGGEIKLDLLRYKNLEEWILEMEKHTEGYEPPEEEAPSASDSDTAIEPPEAQSLDDDASDPTRAD